MYVANCLLDRVDDDGTNDHIDSDTPRSGVATPQPDPSDKRLPGINSGYFGLGQVGSCSSSSTSTSGPKTPISVPGSEPELLSSFGHQDEMVDDYVLLSVTSDAQKEVSDCPNGAQGHTSPLVPEERTELSLALQPSQLGDVHRCPTPPELQPPSIQTLSLSGASLEVDGIVFIKPSLPGSAHRKSMSGSFSSSARRASLMNPLSNVVTPSNVHASHFSNPSDSYPSTTQTTPLHSRLNSNLHESPSYDMLKKLTDDAPRPKSIPPTPTRALSSTTAKSDGSGGAENTSPEKNGKSGTSDQRPIAITTQTTITGTPTLKGKLTVQIKEARGLRKSKDPYVVAVFQRNELVSKGPRPEFADENEDVGAVPMGGIPISRTASDSGRPMAIPMKSRQSSNTSLSEYRDFKSKGRRSMTNPKWDTEAVLYVYSILDM